MEVTREQAIKIFQGLGLRAADGWGKERMLKKIKSLPNLVDANDDLGDGQLNNLLDELLYAVEHEEDISLVQRATDIPEEEEEAPKKKRGRKKKVAKDEVAPAVDAKEEKKQQPIVGARRGRPTLHEKAQGRRLIRESHGRPYQAGRVLAEVGLDKGITTEMVQKVDAYLGSPNAKESQSWLKSAWHIINGYLNGEANAEAKPKRTGRR